MKHPDNMSATCPWVEVRGDGIRINTGYHPHDDRIDIGAYDLEAFIAEVTAARDELAREGYKTAWRHDADGHGNCGAVHAEQVAVVNTEGKP